MLAYGTKSTHCGLETDQIQDSLLNAELIGHANKNEIPQSIDKSEYVNICISLCDSKGNQNRGKG